jgi:hypothetical protein
MYHTTGLTKSEVTELCTLIEEHGLAPGMRRLPPIPWLRNSLTVTQPTISRAISAITPPAADNG